MNEADELHDEIFLYDLFYSSNKFPFVMIFISFPFPQKYQNVLFYNIKRKNWRKEISPCGQCGDKGLATDI